MKLTKRQNESLNEMIHYLQITEYEVEIIRDNIMILKDTENEEEYIITISTGKPITTLIGYDEKEDVKYEIRLDWIG